MPDGSGEPAGTPARVTELIRRTSTAVAPMSVTLWTEPGDSAAGAFDDAADRARNEVFAERRRYAGVPIRLVGGTADPFCQADRAFVRGLPHSAFYRLSAVFGPGGHDGDFWASQTGAQLRFLAAHPRG